MSARRLVDGKVVASILSSLYKLVSWVGDGLFVLLVRGNLHEYRVDLEELHGNGWCGCEDFEKNRLPKLKAGERVSDETRCKHLVAARIVVGLRLLDHVLLNRRREIWRKSREKRNTDSMAKRVGKD